MVDAKVWYAKYNASAKYYGLFNKKIGIWKIQWLGSEEYSQNLRCWGENTIPYPGEANFTIVGTALITHISYGRAGGGSRVPIIFDYFSFLRRKVLV